MSRWTRDHVTLLYLVITSIPTVELANFSTTVAVVEMAIVLIANKAAYLPAIGNTNGGSSDQPGILTDMGRLTIMRQSDSSFALLFSVLLI